MEEHQMATASKVYIRTRSHYILSQHLANAELHFSFSRYPRAVLGLPVPRVVHRPLSRHHWHCGVRTPVRESPHNGVGPLPLLYPSTPGHLSLKKLQARSPPPDCPPGVDRRRTGTEPQEVRPHRVTQEQPCCDGGPRVAQ